MGLNVPVGESILGIVALVASYLDLLETPLRQVDITSTQIAAQDRVSQAESSGQSANTALVARSYIADDLNLPVILVITNGQVAVAGNLLLALRDRSRDIVRVKVASSLRVDQSDDITVSDKSRILLRVEVGLSTGRVKPPLVVGILVVVASDLLLVRAIRISLDVTVQQTTSVTHVFEGNLGSKGKFEGRVTTDFAAFQIGLEERAHLSIARTTSGKDGKVEGERKEVDKEWDDNQAGNSSSNVGGQLRNWHLGVTKLVPEILNGVNSDEGSDEQANKLDTANKAQAETSHE